MKDTPARGAAHAERSAPTLAAPASAPGRRARRLLLTQALIANDLVTLLLATLTASRLRFGRLTEPVTFEKTALGFDYLQVSFAVTLLWLACLHAERLHDVHRLFRGLSEYGQTVRGLCTGVVASILITYALRLPGLSRAWMLLAWTLSVCYVCGGRMAMRGGLRRLRKRGLMMHPTLVVGSPSEASALLEMVPRDPSSGFKLVGRLSAEEERSAPEQADGRCPRLGSVDDLQDVVERYGIEDVLVASSAFDRDAASRIAHALRGACPDVHVTSRLFEVLSNRILVREIAGLPVVTVKSVPLSKADLLAKRVFDLAVAAGLSVLGLPLWIALAATVRLTSPGPVFFRQERVGQDGRPFFIRKFRSMYVDAEERLGDLREADEAGGPLFKVRDDPRMTTAGRWMRKFSLDEFPQLLNVLKGEMSLVGPRPPLPEEVAGYAQHHRQRLHARPGMTGLWQVSGRSNLSFDEMVRLDLFYIENRTLGLDLRLLARTVPTVLTGRGAY